MMRLALRLERASILGFGVTVTFLAVAQVAGFAQLAGSTIAERAAFGAQMELLGRQISYLLPFPTHVETLGGFLQWRFIGTLPLILGLWAALSATGAARGDEERGLAEMWRAAGVSPARLRAGRAAGFLTALGLVLVVTFATTLAVARGEPLEPSAAAATGIALFAMLVVVYAISLVASELLATRRGTLGLSLAIVFGLYFLNSFGRGVAAGPLATLRYISPFALYDRSDPLVPGGTFDVGATAALFALALALGFVAAGLVARRDLGAAILTHGDGADRPPVREPARSALLGSLLGAELRAERGALVGWAAAFALIAVAVGGLARTVVDAMQALPGFSGYRAALGPGDPYQGFFGVVLFGLLDLAAVGYAIVRAGSWGADDAEGRLAAVLAAGASRTAVVLHRVAALVIGVALLCAIGALAAAVGALFAGVALDWGRLALAATLLVPLAAAFGALGAVLLARVPRSATIVLGAVAVWSYFVSQLGPLFHAPGWLLQTSLFELVGGTPLTGGAVRWGGELALIVTAAVGFASAAILMQSRDVGS